MTAICLFRGTKRTEPDALTVGSDGNFYGTTHAGGRNGGGTAFVLTTNGTLRTLATFNDSLFFYPVSALALANDGRFYGTTLEPGNGVVFSLSTNGVLTNLAALPAAFSYGLTLGVDGNLYGTSSDGGPGGNGTCFQVSTAGTITTLFSSGNTNGAMPYATPHTW